MTKRPEKAFAEASKLPDSEQEALAAWILEEIASEQRWQRGFAQSQEQLGRLADEALADHREGRTETMDLDKV